MRRFWNASLNWKIGAMVTLVLLALLAVGVIGIRNSFLLSKNLLEMTDLHFPARVNATKFAMGHEEVEFFTRHLNASVASLPEAEKKQLQEEFETKLASVSQSHTNLEETEVEGELKSLIDSAGPKLEVFLAKGREVFAAALAGNKAGLGPAKAAFAASSAELVDVLDSLSRRTDIDARKAQGRGIRVAESSTRLSIVVLAIGFLAGIAAAYFVTRSISRVLGQVMGELGTQAEDVRSTSLSVSKTADGLKSAVHEQDNSLQKAISAVDEITSMVRKTMENAGRTKNAAEQNLDAASRSQKAISELVAAINQISDSNQEVITEVNNSNRRFAEIVGIINEIATKTKVINDIVFQTKLLSFNASVEAARAGEHGKGFAVVAEEVGNLAQMSGNASKEIGDMLEVSVQKVDGIIKATSTQVEKLIGGAQEKVKAGTVLAERSQAILNEAHENASNVSSYIEEINVATSEQTKGLEEISRAVKELQSVMQRNTEAAEQAGVLSGELKSRFSSLLEVVEVLGGIVRGEQGQKASVELSPTGEIIST